MRIVHLSSDGEENFASIFFFSFGGYLQSVVAPDLVIGSTVSNLKMIKVQSSLG